MAVLTYLLIFPFLEKISCYLASAAGLTKSERAAADDAVLHVEHFTQVQMHEVETAHSELGVCAVVLQDAHSATLIA